MDAAERVASIEAERQIRDWRDESIVAARLALSRLVLDLKAELGERIDAMPWRTALLAEKRFVKAELWPLVEARTKAAVEREAEAAKDKLARIVKHWRKVDAQLHPGDDPDGVDYAKLGGIGGAVAPFAGLGALAFLGTAVNATIFFGLVVNWPVALGIAAVAGAGLATGATWSSGLAERFRRRLKARVDSRLVTTILGAEEGSETAPPSLLARLEAIFAETAEKAIEEVTHGR